MDQKLIFVFPFLIFAFFVQNIFAQCEKENIAFQSGEKITYDLYFKYGVINAKAGIGTLNTTTTNLNGKTVYKMDRVGIEEIAIRRIGSYVIDFHPNGVGFID